MSGGNYLDPNKIIIGDDNKGYLNPSFVPENESSNKSEASATDNTSEDSAKTQIDFDDLLPHIGEFGTYQRILFLMMIPFAFFVAFVYFAQIFLTLVPEEHYCRIPELVDLPLEAR